MPGRGLRAPARESAAGRAQKIGTRPAPAAAGPARPGTGVPFAGDMIYGGPPLHRGRGLDVADDRRSFDPLESLPVGLVHTGHHPSFGEDRLDAIVAR